MGGLLRYPEDAKNVANAHKYINDFLDPEVAAKNGNFVTYAPSSKPARELMEAEFRDDRTISLATRFEKQLHHGSYPAHHFEIHGPPMAGRESR